MKKKSFLNIFISVFLLGLSILVFSTNVSTVKANSYHISYGTRHSIVYKNKNASLRITKVQGFLAKNGHYAPEHQILLYGTLYNKSSHGIVPENFWDDHFRAFQVTHNTWHQLDPEGGASIYDSTHYIESLENIAADSVRPHRLARFILVDEDGLKFWEGQKIAVRTYVNANYADVKSLSTKKFSLDIYGYKAKQQQKLRQIEQEKKAANQRKKEIENSNNFYKTANKFDVYWGNNSSEYKLKGYNDSSDHAYIKNIGYFSPMLMREPNNQIHLVIYFYNNSDQLINIENLINNYFDIFSLDANNKLNFKIDDIKRYNIAKPHRQQAVTFISTNNLPQNNGLRLIVKSNYSTNKRVDSENFVN